MTHRIAPTGTCKAILIFALFLPNSVFADFGTISGQTPEATARWSAAGGSTSFRFDPDLLDELSISIQGPAPEPASDMPGELEFSISDSSQLELWAPRAAWDGFADGSLSHSGRLIIEWPGGSIESEGFTLRPAAADALELVDSAGNALFRLDYIHTMLYPNEQRMTLWNMDMSLTPWLADHMGYPDMARLVIAMAFAQTNLDLPAGAQLDGAGCSVPNWHDGVNFLTDVELSSLGSVQQVARQAGVRVAIAPSATLRNVGSADVPWHRKFTTAPGGTYPEPYDRDQHPFLVWAMYRIVDDIPQQIGQSAVKHAFFSVNSSCDCPGGHILWSADNTGNHQGCGDTYGVGTNDSPTNLGIRDELPAFTGAWEQCGSMFAPSATPPGPCNQTNSGNTGDSFERRLVVEESALETANATYFFEGWYVIRDDVDIFNTMAHKSVTPSFGSSWSFPAGVHTLGPAIDSWVPPGTSDDMQAHTVEATTEGHYSLAVKVTDLGGGSFRYVYALMNYDFDPKFAAFAIPLPAGIDASNVQYLDGDNNGANDWSSSMDAGALTWTAPDSASALEWGFMATFVFEIEIPPSEGPVTLTAEELAFESNPVTLGPNPALDFEQGFEDAN